MVRASAREAIRELVYELERVNSQRTRQKVFTYSLSMKWLIVIPAAAGQERTVRIGRRDDNTLEYCVVLQGTDERSVYSAEVLRDESGVWHFFEEPRTNDLHAAAKPAELTLLFGTAAGGLCASWEAKGALTLEQFATKLIGLLFTGRGAEQSG